ncbi:MAG: glycosyltransferase, partial [Actinomycetota bacterium]|nr:glycosyltransferase [Actinomycetota bacterium]
NLRPEKNHLLLLRAFARVLHALPQAKLVLVGGGPLDAALRYQARAMDIIERVTFLGHVDDVWPHLVVDGVFVLPSRYETSGLVLLEAMAAGMAVIATSVGGITEIVRDGTNALLVPSDDPSAMSAAIVRLVEDRRLRHRLIDEGRRTAAALSMASTVQGYFDIYDRVIALPSGSR